MVRKRLMLTPRRAWGSLGLCCCLFYILAGLGSFLSVTRPVAADIMVVEGWLPDYAMCDALAEFRTAGYRCILTSGGPIGDHNMWSAKYKTFAEFAAANLAAMGLETNHLVCLPAGQVNRDRTFTSALAIRAWMQTNSAVKSLNVYTLGAHARRTRLMFQKALGDNVRVGVFSHPDSDYDPQHWWATSDGFTKVVYEAFAYVYSRCIFPFLPREKPA